MNTLQQGTSHRPDEGDRPSSASARSASSSSPPPGYTNGFPPDAALGILRPTGDVEWVFDRGAEVPTPRRRIVCSAERDLKAGAAGDALRIPVVRGSGRVRYSVVGAAVLPGEGLSTDVAAGSRIVLVMRLDDSHRVSVSAYVPATGDVLDDALQLGYSAAFPEEGGQAPAPQQPSLATEEPAEATQEAGAAGDEPVHTSEEAAEKPAQAAGPEPAPQQPAEAVEKARKEAQRPIEVAEGPTEVAKAPPERPVEAAGGAEVAAERPAEVAAAVAPGETGTEAVPQDAATAPGTAAPEPPPRQPAEGAGGETPTEPAGGGTSTFSAVPASRPTNGTPAPSAGLGVQPAAGPGTLPTAGPGTQPTAGSGTQPTAGSGTQPPASAVHPGKQTVPAAGRRAPSAASRGPVEGQKGRRPHPVTAPPTGGAPGAQGFTRPNGAAVRRPGPARPGSVAPGVMGNGVAPAPEGRRPASAPKLPAGAVPAPPTRPTSPAPPSRTPAPPASGRPGNGGGPGGNGRHGGRGGRRRWYPAFLALAFICVVAALAAGIFACRDETPNGPAASASPTGPPTPSPSASTPTPAETALKAGHVEPPSFEIRVEGANVVETDMAAVVTLRRGLFASGETVISAEGKATLRRFADEIRGHADGLCVLVVGHTDTVPVHGPGAFTDNVSLGMARAVAAIEFLRGPCGLPYGIFVAGTADGSDPIGSNTTKRGRAQNRTVVIKVMEVTKTTT